MIRKSSKNVLAVLLVLCISTVALFTAFSSNVLVPEVAGTTEEATTEAATTEEATTEEVTEPIVTEEPSSEEPSSEVTTEEPSEVTTEEPSEVTTEKPGVLVGVVGDVNQDGRITTADARIALRICVQLENPTDLQLVLADANGDKVLRTADARLILRYAIHLTDADSIVGSEVRVLEGAEAGVTVIEEAE